MISEGVHRHTAYFRVLTCKIIFSDHRLDPFAELFISCNCRLPGSFCAAFLLSAPGLGGALFLNKL
jgi:hypothetical protein